MHLVPVLQGADDADAALSLAMCDLLLGDAPSALKLLEEDERAQQHLAAAGQAKKGKGRGSAAAAAAAAAGGQGGKMRAYGWLICG